MEDDILVVNSAGEAKVHSDQFRRILQSKARDGTVFTEGNLQRIDPPNRNELPDEDFVAPIVELEPVELSSSDESESEPQRAKKNRNKKKKKKAKKNQESTEASSSDESGDSHPKPAKKDSNKGKNKAKDSDESDEPGEPDSDSTQAKKRRKKKKKARSTDQAPKETRNQPQAGSSKAGSSKDTNAYTSSVPLPARPPSPKKSRAVNFRTTLKRIASSEESRNKWLEACQAVLNHAFDPNNTSARKQQEHIVAFWYTFLEEMFPDIDRDDYWTSKVILKHWAVFLTNMVHCSKGIDGGHIRSTTLAKWVHTFVALIGQFMVDAHGKRVGSTLLSRGLFQDIQYRYKWMVDKFKLNRHAPPKGFLSERDLRGMFEYGFAKTEGSGRESFLQTTAAALASFHAGLRVGSMGVTHVEWREKGLYPKLEDIELRISSPGFWDVQWDVKHRKGFNDTAEGAPPLKFLLNHVKQIHHLWFDIGLILAAILFLRGALEGIETVEDLFSCTMQKLRIKESMKQEPLFRTRTAKGHEMGNEAATTDSLLESLQRLGNALGLAYTNFHAIRRETANLYGIILGAEIARRVLGHGDDETTFDRNYSRGAWNQPLSEARLGELDDTLSVANQMAIMRNRKESQIVDAILNADKADPNDPDSKLTAAQKEEIEANDKVVEFNQLINACWDHLFKLLPTHVSVMYGRATGNAGRIQKFVKDTDEYKKNKKKIDRLVSDIQFLGVKLRDIKRQVTKQVKRRGQGTAAQRRAKFAKESAENTIEERSAVQERLSHPSKLFQPEQVDTELASYLDEASTRLPNRDFTNPSFGSGLLEPNFVQRLQDPNLYEFIMKHGDRNTTEVIPDEVEVAFDGSMAQGAETAPEKEAPVPKQGPTARDPELFQEEVLPPFDDSKDHPVFTGDLLKTRMLFFCRLIAPVLREREERRLFRANQGWKCGLCVSLRDFKPGSQMVFNTRALLRRHQSQVHSPWDDLPALMFTETEGVLKCPFKSCDFTAETVDEVRTHCIDDCIDRITFQRMKSACMRERRTGIDDQTLREQARRLKAGKPLSTKTISLYNELKEASESDITTLAGMFDPEDETLPYRFMVLQAVLKTAGDAFDFEEETLTDKNAEDPVDSIYQEFITPAFLAEIEEELSTIEPNMGPDGSWLVPEWDTVSSDGDDDEGSDDDTDSDDDEDSDEDEDSE